MTGVANFNVCNNPIPYIRPILMLTTSDFSAINYCMEDVCMVPIYFVTLDNCWNKNFVTSTDYLCEFSAYTKIFILVV